jgi:protein-tyrosine-phosphatase
MAAGWMRHLAGDQVTVLSGGSEPSDAVNAAAVASMREVGIDIGSSQPRAWTTDDLRAADVVVAMGCGDACPVFPGRLFLDWEIEDPAGGALARSDRSAMRSELSYANSLLSSGYLRPSRSNDGVVNSPWLRLGHSAYTACEQGQS